jgi:hypothetical protein
MPLSRVTYTSTAEPRARGNSGRRRTAGPARETRGGVVSRGVGTDSATVTGVL